MSKKARVVIIGSGIVGCAAAYHLTKFGWKDILVIDKGHPYVNDGSTSHAPGGVVPLSHSKLMTQLGIYSSDLYYGLAPYGDDQRTVTRGGQLEVAISESRWADLKRLHSAGKSYHVDSTLLTAAESKEMLPFLNPAAMVGSLFIPKGEIVKGAKISAALARDAMATGGAEFVGNTKVIDIEVVNGRVVAVHTDNPSLARIETEHALLCANIWAPAISEKIGVHLPLMAFEHQYAISKPMPQLANFDPNNVDHEVTFPTMRELDSCMYYRQHWNCYGVGSYWHKPHMVRPQDVGKTAIHPWTPEDFVEPFEQAKRLLPIFEGAEFAEKFNGMFAFSVDGMPIIGESQVKGFWTAVASWITHAGGVAKSVAEWMVYGDTEWDMRQASVHRFLPFQTTEKFVSVITKKNYREVYDIIHPRQPLSEPRRVRLTPFYAKMQSMGADFTAFAGLELPNWLEENSRLLEKYADQIPERSGWGAQYWSPIQGAEHLATRDNVALFDLTGLAIIEVKGAGAVNFVNYLCSNEMDRPLGTVIYTTWLTPAGGVKRDLAVARVASDNYWMFIGDGTLPQDLEWVNRFAPTDGSVAVNDISNAYTALGLWGPNARKVLEKVTSADVSNEAFPYFTAQWIEIGMSRVLALRISYAGELGWELHIPMDEGVPVFEVLWEAGREYEMIPAGMGAFDSLRIEKGYRLWGADVYTEYNPYEAGLGWTVRLNKGAFIGKEAAQKARADGLKKKLCCMVATDPKAVLTGYEPIFSNGEVIGHVSSANYGYSVGKYIAYGYLPVEFAEPGTQLEVEYFNERFSIEVAREPLFDPAMKRLKS